VGTQVSGTIAELGADFSTIVHRGQVLARLDPALIQAQIDQARTSLVRAEADFERLTVSLEDARVKLARAEELWEARLIPETEMEAAELAVRMAEAQVGSSEAQVGQAEALLDQRLVDLEHSVIESPMDGFVLSREVEVGQTVAASTTVPTLFVLAADLTSMELVVNIHEDDIGRLRPGQGVTFEVDAYPGETFEGTVAQVRLDPISERGVRYATVIDVPNPDRKLTPGMTASLSVETASEEEALRVPEAALQFEPTEDLFTSLGQDPPWWDDEGFTMARIPERRAGARAAAASRPTGGAATIDALFGPLPADRRLDRVWVLDEDRQIRPVDVVLGVSDGDVSALVSGDLAAGDHLVTRVIHPGQDIRESPTVRAPSLFQPPPQPRGRRR
jgi:HlyD family secretion protein